LAEASSDADSQFPPEEACDPVQPCPLGPQDAKAHINAHVQDPAKGAIQGANVTLVEKGWNDVTDAGGNVDFGDVPPGKYTVEAKKDAHTPPTASQTLNVPAGANTQFVLTLTPPAMAHIAVLVKDTAGKPVEGVTVSVDGQAWATKTDSSGNADLGDHPPATYTVKAEISGYDAKAGSASQTKNAPVNVSTQYSLVLSPLHAKIDLAGVAEADKQSVGGLIVRNFDGNKAPRKKITIGMKTIPAGNTADVLVQAGNKVKIFDAATGGTEVKIDGTQNKFSSANLPKDLFVEGATASAAMRDVEISVDVVGVTTKDDSIKLTVLWLDKPDVALSGPIAADDAKRDTYKNWTKAGTYDLGLQEYNAHFAARMGWGSEASAKVHPASFQFPGSDLKLERDADHKYFSGTTVINQRSHNATIPPANDTGPASARDDDPAPNDTIYDWDAAGLPIPVLPAGTIYRVRVNMQAFASITIDAKPVRCSEIREYFIRFSQKQITAPTGSTWQVIDPPDVPSDKQATNGTSNLTWDLK
jgi:co-chaperonin GroES (HSP10)